MQVRLLALVAGLTQRVTTAEPGIKQMFHLVHSERLEYRCDYCDEEAKL